MWTMVLLLACADEAEDGADVQPEAGTWAYEDGGVTSSTCADDLYTDPDAQFFITESDAGTFTVDDGYGDPFPCEVTGSTFVCPLRHAFEYPVPMTDATVLYDIAVEGTLLSRRKMEGTQTFTLDCEGATCAIGELALGVDLPCSYEVAFSAER
jgi:hypothetical protein